MMLSLPSPPWSVSAPLRPSTAEGSEMPERLTTSLPSPAWMAIFLTPLKVLVAPFMVKVTEFPDPRAEIESLPEVPVMIRVPALSTKPLTLPPPPPPPPPLTTLPVMAKLKGFSLPSLLEMLTSPLFVPAEEESRRMVSVSLAPPPSELTRLSVIVKPEGTVTRLMLSVPRPWLVTRKLMLLVDPPVVIWPKLMALLAPSRISLEPLKTAMSGEDGGGVGVVTAPRRLKVIDVEPLPMVSDPPLLPAALLSMRMLKVPLLRGAMLLGGDLIRINPE